MWFCLCAPVFTSEILTRTEITFTNEMSSITSISEEDKRLFNNVQEEIARNVRRMMESLWVNWSHLGIDHSTKSDRIRNLVLIEKDLHKDVIDETEQKLKALTNEVDKLKQEACQLSQYLSMDISIQEFTDNMLLAEYKKCLEDQIVGYRRQVENRKTNIKRLSEWQRDLAESLGVSITEIKEMPLPSDEELTALTHQLELLQEERDKRMTIFLNSQKEIKDIMENLGLHPVLKFESVVVNSLSVEFKVTDRNMERLAELLQSMREQMDETNNRVYELRERLNRVWDTIEEDRVYRSNFLQAHPGCGPSSERAIRDEIQRCDDIKKQKIQIFIAKIRTEIKRMWDLCMYSEKERYDFIHYRKEIFSEDTLTLHEMYLEDLKKVYNDNRLIYETVSQRRELWDKMVQLESQASDPSRYHNRGGQLLQEEKQRKAIANKLPKIEASLVDMVNQYKEKYGKEFTIHGKPLLEAIQEDWETKKTERQIKMSARKQALTPNTPFMGRSHAISPGKRNRTTAGLHTGERPSAKRPLITASASRLPASVEPRNNLKRQAVTSCKKRLSGRLMALAAGELATQAREKPRRKLNYEAKAPRIAVNGSILKNKRRSRRNSRRSTRSHTDSSVSAEELNKVSDSTGLTSYTDFKEHINENVTSRSSLAQIKQPIKTLHTQPILIEETPKKTPRAQPFTPKHGKENMQSEATATFRTPLTRGMKNGFATPRTPLSSAKTNLLTPSSGAKLQRQNTAIATSKVPMTATLTRSKTLTPKNFLI